MTDHNITAIADARYMGLMCPPASPQAKALVNNIINIIEQAEQRKRVRKAKDKAAFRLAVGLITGDLLIAMEVKEYGWSYHGLSPAAFDDRPVGYKTFKPIVETMEAEVKALNSFLVDFELEGGGFSGYRRLFSNGDIDGFDFQWGGRLYGVGDYSYQNIKKTERQKMNIGDEEVVEIDVNASYLTILHGIEGSPFRTGTTSIP